MSGEETEKEIIVGLGKRVRQLEKKVEELELYHKPIGPPPEGYSWEEEYQKKQAEIDADKMIKEIEKQRKKLRR